MQIQALNFRQNQPAQTVSERKELSEKRKKEHDQAKVILSLGALALLGITALAINRSRTQKTETKGEQVIKKTLAELTDIKDDLEVEKKEIASILPDLAQEDNLHLAKLRKLFKLEKQDPKNDSKPSVIIVTGCDQAKIDQMIAKLPEITSTRMVYVQSTSENPIIAREEVLEQAAKHAQETAEKTLIHCGNIDDYFRAKQTTEKNATISGCKQFVDDCVKNDAITAVFSSKALPELHKGQNAHTKHGYIINTDEKLPSFDVPDFASDLGEPPLIPPKEPLIKGDEVIEEIVNCAVFLPWDEILGGIF